MNIYIHATYKGKKSTRRTDGRCSQKPYPSLHPQSPTQTLSHNSNSLCKLPSLQHWVWIFSHNPGLLKCPVLSTREGRPKDAPGPGSLGFIHGWSLPSRCPGWCRRRTGGRVWAWTCTAMEGFDFSVAEAIRNPVSGDWHCECEKAGPEPPFSWFGSRLRWSGPETNICIADSPSWCRSGSVMGSSWYSSDLSLEAQPRVSSWPSD